MKELLNIGVSALYEETLKRKIRISNLISLISVLFMCVFLPVSLYYKVYISSVFNIVFLLLAIANFYFHYRKRHRFPFVASSFFGFIYFTTGTLIYGVSSNMHFFLLIMSLIVIVLFDDPRFIKVYIGLVVVAFSFLMIFMGHRDGGLIQLSEEMKQVNKGIDVSNLYSLFFITITLFLFFKNENNLFQKLILEQKKIVQEKQKEIIDSITYAKRIQEAILPAQQYWNRHLPDSFILYKPKDIVAGDFYWMETINGLIFFAVADCTGHGVPGAMVSVVCNNALNRSLLEFKLSDPGKILDKARELVIGTFGKSDNEVNDGMDISLCCYNPVSHELKWAGANNPLWLIRDRAAQEIKPDKQPVGNYSGKKQFLTHTITLEKGDLIYIFSDGYADQFGGPKGKKLKYRQLEEFILSQSDLPMEAQKQKLETYFHEWRGNLEQIDDVCIIGVRV